MAGFNVNEFSAKMGSYGGLAKTNKFLIRITPPLWYSTAKLKEYTATEVEILGEANSTGDKPLAEPNMLSFMCDTTVLPGKQLAVMDYRPEGFGRISQLPTDIIHDPLTSTFFCDAEHRVQRFFQMWLQEITNTGSIVDGPLATHSDRTSFEMSYKSNYRATVEIYFFNDNGGEVMKYTFLDAFPKQIGAITIGWEQNDTIAKLPIEWAYSTYTVFRESLDTEVFGGRGRGIGNIFQQISYLNGVAGIINNLERPRNIQDLINQTVNLNVLKNL